MKAGYKREENETSWLDGTRKHLSLSNGCESTDREYARVELAREPEWSEAEIKRDQKRYAPRPFSLLREAVATVEEEQDRRDCVECYGYAKTTCDGCGLPLCGKCNADLNERYGDRGDGLCFTCRDERL